MAPDDDDDVLDAWRSCGHAVRVKTLDVVVDGASDEGEDSTSTTVRVRIGTKDVTRDARDVGLGRTDTGAAVRKVGRSF